MKKLIFITFGFLFTFQSYGAVINAPVLMPQGGKAAACLENQVKFDVSLPGDNYKIVEWKGPGVKASADGVIDPTTAVYVFKVSPSYETYAIAFITNDDIGWKLFYYKENGQLRIGFQAPNMESTGLLFKAHERSLTGDDGEVETTPIDLTPCANLFVK